MKKIISLIVCICIAATVFFCGCFDLGGKSGRDGRDGLDGQDVSIYEIYEAAKTVPGNENLTLDEFLKKYLSYSQSELSDLVNKQKVINRSLMSSCSILSRFSYNSLSTRNKVYMGSGVFLWVDKAVGDAYVVTNCHVVYDDSSREVFCDDVRLYLYGQDVKGINFTYDGYGNIANDDNYAIHARVMAASVTYDIALLRVKGSKDSEYISLNLSDVSSTSSKSYRVMRTSAAINHGNSGGGLFNASGELVAIVNSKDDESDVDNMGYALPASNVKRLLKLMYDNYAENGGFTEGISRPMLNVETTIIDSYAKYDNDTGLAEIYETVQVSSVNGMPAIKNLKVGDEIRALKITDSNGTVKESIKVTRRHHIGDVMLSARGGDTLTVTVKRGNEEVDVNILFNSDYNLHYD